MTNKKKKFSLSKFFADKEAKGLLGPMEKCDVCKKYYSTDICPRCFPTSRGKRRKGW